MREHLIFAGQLMFTLLVAAFLIVPAVLSMLAGVTENYFRGIRSGFTLQWVVQVWDLYADTIARSFLIALVTLGVTLARRHSGGLCAACARRKDVARDRGNHYAAARHSRPRDRIGAAADLWRLSRLPPLVLIYRRRPCRVYAAVHGALGDGGILAIDVKTLDESASSLGASPWRRFRDVIVPNALPGILAGSLMVVTLVARRIQSDLDAAHAIDQDAACGAGRQLCLDAA